SFPIRRAAASTRWRGSSRRSFRARSASRSWSTTTPAARASSAPACSSRARPTATRCSSATPDQSPSIPSLYANAGFDPRRDFSPIGLIASMPVALLAHPSFPAPTIGDVVAIGRQQGAKLNLGTSAVGTGGYLSAELFKSITGVKAAIIPYKGTGQVMNDLLGNHVPIAFGVLPPALGNLNAGTLRAIAV